MKTQRNQVIEAKSYLAVGATCDLRAVYLVSGLDKALMLKQIDSQDRCRVCTQPRPGTERQGFPGKPGVGLGCRGV